MKMLHDRISELYHTSQQLKGEPHVSLSQLTRLSQEADKVQEMAELLLYEAITTSGDLQ
ncbi:MAG: hypothetical protein HY913_04220 [Desulfomonile tiedjei]|nr:hypothetical protein [Desulfomonile tiedjei]